MIRREKRRLASAALALSGLCLLPAWDAILVLPGSVRTWEPVSWLIIGTLVAWVLAAMGMGVWPRMGGAWRALAAGAVAILLAETSAFLYGDFKSTLTTQLGPSYVFVRNIIAGLVVVMIFAVCVSVWRLGVRQVLAKLTSSLGILAPLPLVLMTAYFWGVESAPKEDAAGAIANRAVVVLVFDELDDTAISADLNHLPNFAVLRKVGLSATHMYPPANYTSESLPGMLTGEVFQEALYSRSDVHVRHFGESVWHRLSLRGNLLKDSTDLGRRTALVGWHLPYCTFVPQFVSCWDDSRYWAPGGEIGLSEWMLGHSRLYNIYESYRLASLAGDLRNYSREFLASSQMYRLKRIGKIYSEQKEQLLKTLDNRRHELVFAHLACPHPPSLVGEEVNQLDIYEAYARNLRECDGLLGSVMSRLKESGYSEGYALIVTSDHWFRGRDWLDAGRPSEEPSHRRKVPFHLLLSGQQKFPGEVDTITNSRVLRQFVGSAADAKFTLDDARSILARQGDSPTALRKF